MNKKEVKMETKERRKEKERTERGSNLIKTRVNNRRRARVV